MFFNQKGDLLNKLEEKKISELVNNMLQDDQIQKKISPKSEDYFLMDNSRQVYVCIEDGVVRISNHDYVFITQSKLRFTDRLKETVRTVLELETQGLKKTLFRNKLDLIAKIATNYGIR